jgi:hypothetical protein
MAMGGGGGGGMSHGESNFVKIKEINIRLSASYPEYKKHKEEIDIAET